MSTGIETWNVDLLTIGPMYPFPGTEVLWVVIGLATWVIWHIWQFRLENSNFEDDLKTLKQGDNMTKALKGERILRPM